MKLVLASGSPRRHSLIRRLGVDFSILVPAVEEWVDPALDPFQAIRRIAAAKALAVASQECIGLIVAADTAIVLDGRVLGKPVDQGQALEMLGGLQGRSHRVVTALAVVDSRTQRMQQSHVVTRVCFREADLKTLQAYVATGEPMDKAGAYAIQGEGADLVESVRGCHLNVVGFPLCELATLLADFGLTVPQRCTLPGGRPCPRMAARGGSRVGSRARDLRSLTRHEEETDAGHR